MIWICTAILYHNNRSRSEQGCPFISHPNPYSPNPLLISPLPSANLPRLLPQRLSPPQHHPSPPPPTATTRSLTRHYRPAHYLALPHLSPSPHAQQPSPPAARQRFLRFRRLLPPSCRKLSLPSRQTSVLRAYSFLSSFSRAWSLKAGPKVATPGKRSDEVGGGGRGRGWLPLMMPNAIARARGRRPRLLLMALGIGGVREMTQSSGGRGFIEGGNVTWCL